MSVFIWQVLTSLIVLFYRAEPLAIEIKLSLDRWCKPESLPSPAPSPEKTATLTSASSGQFGNMMGGGARSANSSRFMFSSFLGFGSTGETSASTFNMHDAHNVSAGSQSGRDAGMMPLPPSVTSMSSEHSGNGSSATTLPGLSGKHRPLPKIIEESHEFSRSESSSAQESHQANQRHLRPTARSHSNEALDAMFDFGSEGANTTTNSPTNPSNNSNNNHRHGNSKSTGNILDRVRAAAHHTPSHISSSTSSGASSSRRSGKSLSLRAKERTWVYHAVMSVVQDMEAEHEVPIVVFL